MSVVAGVFRTGLGGTGFLYFSSRTELEFGSFDFGLDVDADGLNSDTENKISLKAVGGKKAGSISTKTFSEVNLLNLFHFCTLIFDVLNRLDYKKRK
jgi:hypothetical protein